MTHTSPADGAQVHARVAGRRSTSWTALAVAALLAALAACERSDLETDNCIRTRLVTPDVSADRPEQLVLSATLETQAGEPVADRRVDFGLAQSLESTPDYSLAATTDASGRATVDAASRARDFTLADEAVRKATVLVVDYRNPDGFTESVQPNFCSTKVKVAFRYTGPPDYSPARPARAAPLASWRTPACHADVARQVSRPCP